MIVSNFAVIEGCDGSGTTTQLKQLKKNFSLQNISKNTGFFVTGEPTRGPLGLMIRKILMGKISVQKETLARLFAADRGEHLYAPGGIIERCGRNELVVSDRYTPSSLVYQGLDCGRELPETLNAAFPHPELLIYLDLDTGIVMERIAKRKEKREIYEYMEFQAKVREAYLELLPIYEQAGVRVICLDGSGTPEELAIEIWSKVMEMPIMEKVKKNR
ncbi:MAG: dTMP kinase [Treponema sp.]|jgi:dTMP kinase|nr:dTMP kinase [Treponema sp.]